MRLIWKTVKAIGSIRRLRNLPRDRGRVGFTLFEFCIALGIGSVLVLAAYRLFSFGTKSSRNVRARIMLQELELELVNRVDCPSTRLLQTCAPFVSLYDQAANVVVAADGSTVERDQNLRAICRHGKVFLEYRDPALQWKSFSGNQVPLCMLL